MAATHGLGTYGNAVGTVTPLDHKLAQSGLLTGDSTAVARAGVLWCAGVNIVTGSATMSYNVAAFRVALTRGATAGVVILANDATVSVVTTAAPGANSRYDVVYVWQREFSLDGTDSNPVIGVVQGTAAASPTVPSLASFPGAIALATILVPTGVTATNTGTTITQVFPYTATSGGFVLFRKASDLTAWTTAQTGQRAYVYADSSAWLNGNYVYDGSSWNWDDVYEVNLVTAGAIGAGWTPGTGPNAPRIKLQGKQVTVYGQLSWAGGGSYATMFTVPSGFMPPTLGASRFIGTGAQVTGTALIMFMMILAAAGIVGNGTGGTGSLPASGTVFLNGLSWWMD